MKKTLLLGSFAIFALVANAQFVTQVTTESAEGAGFDLTAKTDIAAGVVFGNGEAGTIETAYADSWGTTDPCGGYKMVKVGDTEVQLSGTLPESDFKATGAVGNTNPTFTNYASGVMSAGAVFAIKPAKAGWLTIFTKLNPNKQYVVFEGKSTGMAYTLGYANQDAELGQVKIHYTLPFNANYAIDFDAADAADYFIAAGGDGAMDVKPQFPWIVSGLFTAQAEATEGYKYEAQNTGFLTFNVVPSQTYYVAALGSKAAMGTFVITEGDVEPSVTFLATDELPEVTFEGGNFNAGIEGIMAEPINENAPVYNLFGQKVNDTYKGIVIKNGKKFIQR